MFLGGLALLSPIAEIHKQADGQAGGRGRKKNPAQSFHKVSRDFCKVRTKAAAAVGVSGYTYEKAKLVIDSSDRGKQEV